MTSKKPFISAVLHVESDHQIDAIRDRIDNNNAFTLIPTAEPPKVAPHGLAILVLPTFNAPDEVYLCIMKKQGRVATGVVRLKGTEALQLSGLR